MMLRPLGLALALTTVLAACQPAAQDPVPAADTAAEPADTIAAKVAAYTEVTLSADLSHLSEGDRLAIGLLLQAGEIMDGLFWKQVYGDRDGLLSTIDDPATRRFVEINYGPWDRLDNDAPFVDGVGPRPPGARFYPADMTKEEFAAADLPGQDSLTRSCRATKAAS